jgi:uncharacterized protein YbaP (TraB family)
MKLKSIFRAGAALALLASPTAWAQDKPATAAPAAAATQDADPALWVVKDKDTTIYLFGTVHVLKPGLRWFDEAVKAAFDKSDKVMLEMVEPDPAAMQQLIVKLALNPTGPTVTEMLPEDRRAPYAAAMTDVGVPPAALDRMDPWLPAVTLSIAMLPKYGYDPNAGAERTISAAAKAAGKPVEGLETAEQQIGYFDGLPQPLQVRFLVQTIDQLPQMGSMLDKMVASWSAGDPDTLAVQLNEGMRETPELAKILLSERNARWADWIANRMAQPGTVFVAVGAGHLAGGDSVQAYLAKHRFKAKRVKY